MKGLPDTYLWRVKYQVNCDYGDGCRSSTHTCENFFAMKGESLDDLRAVIKNNLSPQEWLANIESASYMGPIYL